MAAGQPRQQDGAVGAHLQKGHRPAQRDVGRLRGGRHRLGLDRRYTQVLGRHLVFATPHAAPRAIQLVAEKRAARRAADSARAHATRWHGACRSRTQRWALGHRLRRQRHHGDARRLFGSTATRPRCPRFLRHAQTPEPVHHLPPAAQRQAGGNAAEADGGVVGEVGARREPLIFVASVSGAPRIGGIDLTPLSTTKINAQQTRIKVSFCFLRIQVYSPNMKPGSIYLSNQALRSCSALLLT